MLENMRIFDRAGRLFQNKEDFLIKLLADNSYDILREALAAILPLFGDVDLTIFDMSAMKSVESTIINQDDLTELTALLSHFIVRGNEFLPKNVLRRAVTEAYSLSIRIGDDARYVLIVESYDIERRLPRPERFDTICTLLGLAVKLHLLQSQNAVSVGLDGLTGIPGREALVRELSKRNEKSYVLGVLGVMNLDFLNASNGGVWTDEVLREVASQLTLAFGEHCYRISGAKFSIIFESDVYTARSELEKFYDVLLGQQRELKLAAAVTLGRKDPYQTIFLCEKNLQQSTDCVVILHSNTKKEDMEAYSRMEATYTVEGEPELSNGEFDDEDIEVLDN